MEIKAKGSISLKVTYNMWDYQSTGYKPRLADPRIGYFTQDFKDLGVPGKPAKNRQFIKRFSLAKKDPQAAVSEPVKPIEFTLDTTIPEKYKDAVRDGILRWNKAFDAIGYKNAIVVKDASKDDPDYDHSNGKYNIVRWSASTSDPYAIALMRTDPFTGEVLNASVTFDVNWLSAAKRDYQSLVVPGTLAQQKGKLKMGQFKEISRNILQFGLLKDPVQDALQKGFLYEGDWAKKGCLYGYALAPHSSFAYNMALSYTKNSNINKEGYEKQLIGDVIAHEIGHLLGLRHNFKGSDYLTTSELGNDQIIENKNSTASVMDYLPPNIMAVLGKTKYFYPPEIGPYDIWAIRYGYSDIDAKTPEDEKIALRKIASESSKPGLEFATDEDMMSADPFVVAFDNAKDPIDYQAKVIQAARNVEQYAIHSLSTEKSYEKRTRLLLDSIYQRFAAGAQVANFIGGIETHKYHLTSEGVERPTLKPLDADLQYKAMNLILKECLSINSVNYPENVLNSMSAGYLPPESTWNAPLRNIISYLQMLVLYHVINPDTLSRIAENHFKSKSSSKEYSVIRHLNLVSNSLFYEVGRNMNIKPLRRDLQLFAVAWLLDYARDESSFWDPGSSEARLAASRSVRELLQKINNQLQSKAKLDEYTTLHLQDLKEKVELFYKRIPILF